nr:AGE family epimerase/isomerase [Nocardioides convexus]
MCDTAHDGWFHALDADGRPDLAAGKTCYDHAFVLLGTSSAVVAGLPGADALLAAASTVFLERFWDEDAGRCRDEWSADWSRLDSYRGLNANMHAVEAMLAVADATGDLSWRRRAARVADFVVDLAARYDARLPEHFDAAWTSLPDLNADRPADPFKPYGATIGHGLEWSRLLLTLDAVAPDERLLPTAEALFDRAVADGWSVDGTPGFVYTTDWSGTPVVRDRMHWVLAEALAAAAALLARTGEQRYAAWFREWWAHAEDVFIDRAQGSWHHQTRRGQPPRGGRVAGQARPLPRGPGHPAPAAPALPHSRPRDPGRSLAVTPPEVLVVGEALIDIVQRAGQDPVEPARGEPAPTSRWHSAGSGTTPAWRPCSPTTSAARCCDAG